MLFRNLSFFAKQVASKKPNSTLPAASAVSALTARAYPKSKTTELVARGFTSPVWLTEKQMETIGVGLKPGAQEKVKSSPSRRNLLHTLQRDPDYGPCADRVFDGSLAPDECDYRI